MYGPQLDHARVAYAVDWRLIAALASIAVIVGASSFFVGARRCAGLRDGILTTRAAFRIGIGLALCFWLARLPLRAFGDDPLLGACVPQTALLLASGSSSPAACACCCWWCRCPARSPRCGAGSTATVTNGAARAARKAQISWRRSRWPRMVSARAPVRAA